MKKGVHKSLVVKWKSNKAELLKQLSDNAHRGVQVPPRLFASEGRLILEREVGMHGFHLLKTTL